MMTKKELRQLIRMLKQQHSTSESAVIIERLKQNEHFAAAHTLFLYSALADEVQIQTLLDELIEKGKRVLLPRVTSDIDMELRLYTGPQSLRQGAFGILEPVGEIFKDYEQIDVAVIPGMAFDAKGHRLGRGKGYYDHFLAHLSPLVSHLYKIGICFPWQMVDEVPADEHDVSMDCIVSQT